MINNFTFGISYNPNIGHLLEDSTLKENFDFKNLVSLVGSYDKKINKNLKIKLSIMGELGNFNRDAHLDVNYHDLNAWHLGGFIEYKKISATANIGFWNKVGHVRPLHNHNLDYSLTEPKVTHYYDLATAIDITDKFSSSLTYFQGNSAQNFTEIEDSHCERGHIRFQNLAWAADYKLHSDYLKLYVEINKFAMRDNNQLAIEKKQNNNGWVTVIGGQSFF